jgi:hypothetical protein
VLHSLDLLGTFAFALSGSSLATAGLVGFFRCAG